MSQQTPHSFDKQKTEPLIAQVALPTPLRTLFDYLVPADKIATMQPGIRVRVPFGQRSLVGIVIHCQSNSTCPSSQLRSIETIIDEEPLFSADHIDFLKWLSLYYHAPIGEVIFSSMPKRLKEGKSADPPLLQKHAPFTSHRPPIPLSKTQENTLHWIQSQTHFAVGLLEGVTGSGKTEVYIQSILQVLEKKQQALFLIPEIALFSQTMERLKLIFGPQLLCFHSQLTEKERYNTWKQVSSPLSYVVIGARSALFLPFSTLGLIVVDEEHDPNYKQTEGLRYQARDSAIWLAHQRDIPILLGSATPSLMSLHRAQQGRYTALSLPDRVGSHSLPEISIIDCQTHTPDEGLSAPLRQHIRKTIEEGQQVLLFLNRRGYAPTLFCPSCRHIPKCDRCDRSFTFHQASKKLWCHHCNSQKTVPSTCEACQEAKLVPLGIGIERVEEALKKYFPDTPLIRIDSDNTRLKGQFEEKITQIHTQKPAIILGTQMLAKGHHFPDITLVAILDVDGGLLCTDYHAIERMGQLITQVAGRAGRGDKPGHVLLQTYYPQHPLLQRLISEGYSAFSAALLEERKETLLPPFTSMAILRVESSTEAQNYALLNKIASLAFDGEKIGPFPALLPKKAGLYRTQLILTHAQRPALQQHLRNIVKELQMDVTSRRVRWHIDVDPIDFA